MQNVTTEQKMDIAAKANAYILQNSMTAAQFSKQVKVNQSYLSNILNGNFVINAGENSTPIQDKYFVQIAEAVGYNIRPNHWPHINTAEFVELIAAMKEAKQTQVMKTLIVDTGAGKTYAVNAFKKVNPLHTYVVTMHSEVTINELFNELSRQLGIPDKGSKGWKRAQILIKLREIRRNGGYPIVLIDEGENMTSKMMMMMKGFYDGVHGYASLVLIGTEQLWEVIEQAKLKDKQSGPQFYRRFKPGARHIKLRQKLSERFAPFFDALGIAPSFRKLLCEMCENYGELHDYLEPALKKAEEMKVPLTEELFRMIYNLPKAA